MDNTDETIKKRFELIQEVEDDIITIQDPTNSTAGSTKIFITPEKQPLPLHRQARGYMKTTASLVGKDMEQERSLFTLPSYDYDTKALKDVLSKNTAITGNLLLALWQKNKNEQGIYTIESLTTIADLLHITPQELKIYLIYLGGYQYPVVKFNKETRILSVYHDKLFFVKFNIQLKDGETQNSFTNDDRIGNTSVNFIRDRDIKSIDISPSKSIIEEYQGKGLGNVLVDDAFISFCLGLSELAYKLFSFSGSNKPTFTIRFDKLISKKYLNLEKQVKGVYDTTGKRKSAGQGKARVLKRIQEALTELKSKGHFTSWAYDEARDMFSWTYCNKIIKHKELLPLKIKPEETGQTGQ